MSCSNSNNLGLPPCPSTINLTSSQFQIFSPQNISTSSVSLMTTGTTLSCPAGQQQYSATNYNIPGGGSFLGWSTTCAQSAGQALAHFQNFDRNVASQTSISRGQSNQYEAGSCNYITSGNNVQYAITLYPN